jgi:hypothetical protein
MIKGPEQLCLLFNIFHDGGLTLQSAKGDEIVLRVDIQYLAERFDPAFEFFTVRLTGVAELWFAADGREQAPLTDSEEIFALELEILSGSVVGEAVNVKCASLSLSPGQGWSTGNLRLSPCCAEVWDQGGKRLGLTELEDAARSYWDEFSRRGR